MKHINIRFSFGWIMLLGIVLGQSCTKNELTPYEREPLNKILEYKVTNNPQHMMGAISQEDNTIKIYIPYYTNLDYLVASIKLDEGATLLRVDSTEINLLEDELDPVTVGDTVQYIVRSATGEYRTYTLTQEILPHSTPLQILGYANAANTGAYGFKLHAPNEGVYSVNANKVFYLFGNFLSSSRLGSFTLTNEETGETFKDYVNIVSVEPQADNNYVMTARISPQVAHGTYQVSLEHQGRTTALSPLAINYKLFYGTNYSSSTSFAQGDTITFEALDATYSKPTRIYTRINRSTRDGDVPPNFPENLYGQELEMKVVSSSRTQIKAILPDIPAGIYRNYGQNVINFLAVFSEEEGFEENTAFNQEVKIGIPSGLGFTVVARQQ